MGLVVNRDGDDLAARGVDPVVRSSQPNQLGTTIWSPVSARHNQNDRLVTAAKFEQFYMCVVDHEPP